MTVTRCWGTELDGVHAALVEVEAHMANGLPGVTIVGLPDAAVNEARERVRAAVMSSGANWPERRITVGLLPASRRKRGAGLDLAIAVAVLSVSGQVDHDRAAGLVLIGEVGLDGRVHAVQGTLARVAAADRAGRTAIVARDALGRARLVNPEARSVCSLHHLMGLLRGQGSCEQRPEDCLPIRSDRGSPASTPQRRASGSDREPDMADVEGQQSAKYALLVAAAGAHNILMTGPPGTGKTMLAERLPTILPSMTAQEAVEVAVVCSASGDREPEELPTRRPFVAPHHSTTAPTMIGGSGNGRVRPGLVTQAHHGVLFLDEAPEFRREALEGLREPLERGQVTVARVSDSVVLPARFQLVMTANPCPCGGWTDDGAGCRCPVAARHRYRARLSGPLLDRIDLTITVRPEPPAGAGTCVDSESWRERVVGARERMAARLSGLGCRTNAELTAAALMREHPPTEDAAQFLGEAIGRGDMSLRAAHRIQRVAWTLADLEGVPRPGLHQITSAWALWRGEGW